MRRVQLLAGVALSMAANFVMAVPVETSTAIGGFVSWRDCTTAEQAFCNGAVGTSHPVASGGTADRSIIGSLDSLTLADGISGPDGLGSSSYSFDLSDDAGGVEVTMQALAGRDGRVAATAGALRGYTYAGEAATTKTLDIFGSYSHSSGFDELARQGSAWLYYALIMLPGDFLATDTDFHGGTELIGMDIGLDVASGGTTYTDYTMIDEFFVNSFDGAGTGFVDVTGSIDIYLNPGDTFYLVVAGQTIGNQGGFGILNSNASFDDESDLIAVPAPSLLLLLGVGFLGIGLKRQTTLLNAKN